MFFIIVAEGPFAMGKYRRRDTPPDVEERIGLCLR
jgi:hypothetical protein